MASFHVAIACASVLPAGALAHPLLSSMVSDIVSPFFVSSVAKSSLCGDVFEIIIEAVIVLAVFAVSGTFLKKAKAGPRKVASKVACEARPVAAPQPWRSSIEETGLAFYNDSMKKAAARGDVEKCSQICKDIRTAGLSPSEGTFEILLDACLTAKDYDRASAILIDIGKAEVALSVGHCAACVRGLASEGRTSDIEALVQGLFSASQKRFDGHTFRAGLTSAVGQFVPFLVESQKRKTQQQAQTPLRSSAPQGPQQTAASARPAIAANSNAASVLPRLEQFIKLNNLDPRCAQTLRKIDIVQAEWIMDQEFKIEVDPTRGSASAKVVGTYARAVRKPEEFWESYPTTQDLQKRLQKFIALNNLDRRCIQTLEQLSEERLKWVMGREFLVQVDPARGTASAKVIGRVVHSAGTEKAGTF